MIKLYQNTLAFTEIQRDWDDLYKESPHATPYQLYDFVKLSWEIWSMPDDVLYIVCHHKKEEWPADAIFPCYIRNGELRLIDFHSDFCNPLECAPLNERHELYFEFFNFIKSDIRVKRICFHNITSDCPLAGYFTAFGRYPDISAKTGYSVIEMTDNPSTEWIGNITTLAKQKQRKVKDIIKKYASVELVTFNSSDSGYPEDDIEKIASSMVKADIRSENYLSAKFKDYLKSLYVSGITNIAIIYENKIPRASFFLLFDNHANEWIEWILLYTDKRYNIVLMCEWLKKMHETQPPCHRLNLACGLYEYKLHNFHPAIHLVLDLKDYSSIKEKRKAALKLFTCRITNKIKFILRSK